MMKKLNSKKGSALLLAMLFSLICLLLGVAILSAGVTSNGRIVNAAKSEQAYFLVSSVFNVVDYETRVTDEASNALKDFRFKFKVEGDSTPAEMSKLGDSDKLRNNMIFEPYITSALNDAIVTGRDQKRRLDITFGEELGADYKYTVQIEMTVKADDYSIYFDVTDILKDDGASGEPIGLPNLHTIAVEAKSVTPLKVENDIWKEIEFEYHRAKYVK